MEERNEGRVRRNIQRMKKLKLSASQCFYCHVVHLRKGFRFCSCCIFVCICSYEVDLSVNALYQIVLRLYGLQELQVLLELFVYEGYKGCKGQHNISCTQAIITME